MRSLSFELDGSSWLLVHLENNFSSYRSRSRRFEKGKAGFRRRRKKKEGSSKTSPSRKETGFTGRVSVAAVLLAEAGAEAGEEGGREKRTPRTNGAVEERRRDGRRRRKVHRRLRRLRRHRSARRESGGGDGGGDGASASETEMTRPSPTVSAADCGRRVKEGRARAAEGRRTRTDSARRDDYTRAREGGTLTQESRPNLLLSVDIAKEVKYMLCRRTVTSFFACYYAAAVYLLGKVASSQGTCLRGSSPRRSVIM